MRSKNPLKANGSPQLRSYCKSNKTLPITFSILTVLKDLEIKTKFQEVLWRLGTRRHRA